MKKAKVLFIITGLDTGGAEMMLFKLLTGLNLHHFEPLVVSLSDKGVIATRMEQLGIPVDAVGLKKDVGLFRGALRLGSIIRQFRPDVIQTWMYHADLFGGVVARLTSQAPVAWNIRHSDLDLEGTPRRTRMIARACAILSWVIPKQIVCCSHASSRSHVGMGYSGNKMLVIPNGFDTDGFRPDTAARIDVRRTLKIPEGAPLIGMVARFHPYKDHPNFMRAAALVQAELPNAHFVLCGADFTSRNTQLGSLIREVGTHKVHLLGIRTDVPRVLASLDLAVLSSYTEGFPNVVGEAMSCGVPCVVTDVGDSRQIVADTGQVVPARNPEALAEACLKVLRMSAAERIALGERARARVLSEYSLGAVVGRYEALYRNLALD